MSDLKSCPICGKQLKVYGPEDWKPSFYDPDGGGDPYCFVCDCGFHFDTDTYDYQEAVERANRRANDESELKKCPFCGGEAKFFTKAHSLRGTTRGWEFGIYCTRCNVTTPSTCYELAIELGDRGEIKTLVDDRAKAASDWNRRANNE